MTTCVKTENGVAMCLVVYLDVSGSMCGTIYSVLDEFELLLKNVMHEYDRICVKLFNKKMMQAFTENISVKHLLGKYDVFRRFVHSRVGSTTQLYAAITDAMDVAFKLRRDTIQYLRENKKHRTVITNVIVFTDGGDDSGKPPHISLMKKLVDPGKPDFHFTLMSVDSTGVDPVFVKTLLRENQATQVARTANRQTSRILNECDVAIAFRDSQASLRAMRVTTTVKTRSVRIVSPPTPTHT